MCTCLYFKQTYRDKYAFFKIAKEDSCKRLVFLLFCCVKKALKEVESSLFLTKVYFEVKDCSNNILIKSELGTSREKDYKKAFNEAFGKALNSIKNKLYFKRSDSNKDMVLKSEKEVVFNLFMKF